MAEEDRIGACQPIRNPLNALLFNGATLENDMSQAKKPDGGNS
jgi:hypothetical protein